MIRPIPLILRRRLEHIKMFLPIRSDLQYARQVAAPVAVVWSGPDCRELVVVEDGETFHAELVGAEDVHEGVGGEEFADDLGTEGVAGASVGASASRASVR